MSPPSVTRVPDQGQRQSKSVAVTYGSISTALVVLVAALALIVKPPSPPALAEFAPQVDETIDDTSENQSSQFGIGGNGICAAGQVGCEGVGRPPEAAVAAPVETPPIPRRPGIRCVGNPPRQIEDPQSPPCAEPWKGDNGGATSMGVTRDEIRVAMAPSLTSYTFPELEQIVKFFNDRFEFYGRRIVLVDRQGSPGSGRPPPLAEQQRRTADYVAEVEPFAAIRHGVGGRQIYFRTRLAELGVISVLPDDDYVTEAQLRRLHPYAWGYQLSYDRLLTDLAQFVCHSLLPGRATYAGPGTSGRDRMIGVVEQVNAPSQPREPGDIDDFIEGLQACNVEPSVKEYTSSNGDTSRTQARTVLSSFQQDNVTTIVSLGDIVGTEELVPEATSLGYFPEWLLAGGGLFSHLDEVWQSPRNPPEQPAHLFALGGWNKGLPPADRPSTWALNEAGVALGPQNASHRYAEVFYQSLLVLASGIQAAGPHLTPESFARGLQQLRFPNPGAGAAPYYQATVGFAGDHTMIEDETVQWWSADAPAYRGEQSQGGGWCYAERGARWGRDAWPRKPFALFGEAERCR